MASVIFILTCPGYEDELLNVSLLALCLFFLFPLSKPVLRKLMFLLIIVVRQNAIADQLVTDNSLFL